MMMMMLIYISQRQRSEVELVLNVFTNNTEYLDHIQSHPVVISIY